MFFCSQYILLTFKTNCPIGAAHTHTHANELPKLTHSSHMLFSHAPIFFLTHKHAQPAARCHGPVRRSFFFCQRLRTGLYDSPGWSSSSENSPPPWGDVGVLCPSPCLSWSSRSSPPPSVSCGCEGCGQCVYGISTSSGRAAVGSLYHRSSALLPSLYVDPLSAGYKMLGT